MARVILSNHSHQPIVELRQAANVKWHKALNTVGYAEFDLPLSDTYATPTYLNAGNYVHIFSDSASSTSFTNADFGGQLSNDYEVTPQEGVIKLRAAGLANLLNVSIVNQTTIYTNMTVASIVKDLIQNRNDNATRLGLTIATNAGAQNVTLLQVNFGANLFNTIETLVTTYNCDFEVRPDWSWASYDRQGVNRPNWVARYGDQGNVQVQATMHILNTQLFNQVYVGSDSSPTPITVVDASSTKQYGYFSEYLSAGNENVATQQDEQTQAQVELARHAQPPVMLDGVVLVDSPLMPFGTFGLGDKIYYEAPQNASTYTTIIPRSASPTPLSLYQSTVAAPDLKMAGQMTVNTASALTYMSTPISVLTGYGEVAARGTTTAWAAGGNPGLPSGLGFLYDGAALHNTQSWPGAWNQSIALQCGDGLGITGNLLARWFVYHSTANTYTSIGTTTLSGQSIGATPLLYSFPAPSVTAINFGVGDMLYMDCWVNITTNSTGTTAGSLNYVGIANMLTAQQADMEGTDTSGFIKSPTVTLSQDTTQSWHGTGSLKVVTTGNGWTFESVSSNTPAGVFALSSTYSFSVYAKSSTGTPTLRFYAQANDRANGNTNVGAVNNITLSTSWQRFAFTITTPSSYVTNGYPWTTFGFRIDTGNYTPQVTYWLDGMQANAGLPAPWVPGGLNASPQLVTQGYVPTLTQQQTIGALPMLSLFNGLQRILTMDYDDRNRTLALTLGNAIYKVIRGKLSEIRLYT